MTNVTPALLEKDLQLIHRSLIFKGVSVEDIGHLIAECELLDIPSGKTLIYANARNEHFYVVLTGSLKVYLDVEINESFVTLHPGDCVGELSVFDGAYTSAQVIAASDCHLLRIDNKTLWRLVRASHNFSRNLLHVLAKRMRKNNVAIINGLRHQQELEYLANVDGLTGLFNRRWMNEFFQRQIARALRDNKPMALLIADLDHIDIAFQAEKLAGQGERRTPLTGAGLSGQAFGASHLVEIGLGNRGVGLVAAGGAGAFVFVVDVRRCLERLLEAHCPQQRCWAPQRVNVAYGLGDFDPPFRTHLLAHQVLRKDGHQRLGRHRLFGARMQRRWQRFRKIRQKIVPLRWDVLLAQREVNLFAHI